KKKTVMFGLEFSTKEKILRILAEEDTYGYDLWKKIGKIMTRNAIYQHLNELTCKGLIASYRKGRKKYFRITDRGMRILRAIDELKVIL
ncbi:MAG TPA: hypothetical protein ENG10_01825, partial [Candidatus Bathyarchaeota archaeon]|nr:hypothetical protein [Candidatus Bathyarchaeota archaeon]HEX69020.1 hypothetical protein [Candidatus Bathyarchaeota archaeon]